ncbi:MAG: hypothetical protein WC620_08295 [Methanoregula sp.]
MSVPITAPVTGVCPDFVRVTVDPLKPVPTMTMVCEPLFAGLEGEILEITGAVVVATSD